MSVMRTGIAVISISIAGCLISTPAPINTPADCDAAGARLQALACSANGRPLWITPRGTPFADVCKSAKIPYNADRLSVVNDCSAVDSVFRGAK
jgi:hypothetical protein